jgi:uncharacterized protein YkwD
MLHRFLFFFVVLATLATAQLTFSLPGTAQTAGTVSGPLPGNGGVALIVSGGGHIDTLTGSAANQGCEVRGAWTTSNGAFAGYIPGALGVANAAFLAQFPGGSVVAGAALLLDCLPSSGPASGSPAAASPTPPPPPPPPAALTFDQQVANTVFTSINQARQNAGLPPLAWNGALQSAAEQYAALVRDTGQVSHYLDGDPPVRAQRAGYSSTFVAEVIGMVANTEALAVQRDADGILATWMNSAPHRAIILGGEYSDGAIGCAAGTTSDGFNAVYCVGLTGAP